MIELDLKGAGWLGRALAAVACHSQQLGIRRGSCLTARLQETRLQDSRGCISRGGISRRAMRLSVRHLGGLIYNAVDDFVRGPM